MTVAQLKKHLETRLSRIEHRRDKRFTAIERRFSGVDARLVSVDARLASVDARLASGDARSESIGEKLDAILGFVKSTHKHTTAILDEHEQRLQTLERR